MYTVTFFAHDTNKLERRRFEHFIPAHGLYQSLMNRAYFQGRKYCYLREGNQLIASGQRDNLIIEEACDNFERYKELRKANLPTVERARSLPLRPDFFDPNPYPSKAPFSRSL